MAESSSDGTEFNDSDLALAAANSLAGPRRKTRAGGTRLLKDVADDISGQSKAVEIVAVSMDVSTIEVLGG